MEPLDWQRADSSFGDRELFLACLQHFEQDLKEELERLAVAVEAADYGAAQEQAHSLKGALLYLHAGSAAEAARQLQGAAKRGDAAALATELERLNRELARLREAIP